MLQIIVNNQQVDLLEDTEVSITIEHPMLSTDHIPVPYSTDIDLPLSPRNRVIFGFVDRPARTAAFESLPARIFFDGLEITSGEIKVSEVEETITASYNGVMIPANVDKMAYRQNLGRIDFGASAVQVACNNYFIARTEEEYPDLVAAPVSIDARVTGEIVDGNTITQVSAAAWLNGYDESNGDYLPDQYRRDSHLNKILPAFRVGWLLDKLLDGRCVNNIFNTGEWRRLMILSTWHPRYKPDDQSAVYDIDDQGNASLTLADFMPKKAANEIITELLKLPCASMYATGDSFTIELNRDILDRKVIGDDWTGKVIGRVTISEQEAQRYVAGYSQEDAELAVDLQVTDSDDILHICSLNPTQEIQPGTFNVANTGQVIERIAADDVTGALGSDHDNVNVLRSSDGLEVDVEAVCKGQCLALGHVGSNLGVVDIGAQLIGHQHHDNIAGLGSLFHLHDLEVVMGGSELRSLCPVSRTLAQADHNVDAALSQILRVCMTLAAEADDSDGLAVQHAEVAVGIVVFLDSHSSCSPFYSSVVANNKRSLFFRSPGSGKNIQVRSGQWVPGRGSWAARTSCGGFCIC